MAGPGGALAIPLSFVEHKPDSITLRFVGLVAALMVVPTSSEIRTTVDHNGRNWQGRRMKFLSPTRR